MTSSTAPGTEFVLTVSCRDRLGIVHRVSGFLAELGFTILESRQFGEASTDTFFLRLHARSETGPWDTEPLRKQFEPIAAEFDMDWQLHDTTEKRRLIVMVSRFGHCLNDLLYRVRSGSLPVEIAAVVSNHRDFEDLTTWHGLPFHHVPVTADTKPQAERQLLDLVEEYEADTVVLARYMQVLSDNLCTELAGRVINIHHSLLPSFKGARPYAQAHARGVKVIGATAHFVTADLDEGPIIEQAFARVDHGLTPAQLTALGRDLEAGALARAVQWHAEHRVLLNGHRTVVFD
ncbi:formyltetrahydrofolate deformylase [Streptomyces lutosisoli]|uniref:Formyltetrahydrofolate deformylase n=1 Tax=Streptomyces lutosisoli TaxID=2665721 RepID=A0ABW2VSG8_9ACTN